MSARILLIFLAALAGASASAAPANEARTEAIAWHAGDVDAAFAQARREHKPLFLYWGAVWCPPCNQVKATIFPRRDFIERARLFVPVYLDGDAPNAQKIASRFRVSAYPTMILIRSDGTEITRLPGEVDGARYMQALALGMNAGRPVDALLAAATKGARLAPDDWRRLALHSWETDQRTPAPKGGPAPLLWQLAQASSAAAPDAAARFTLKAVSLAADGRMDAGIDKRAARARIEAALDDPRVARANFSELTYGARAIVEYLSAADTPARAQLRRAWDRRLTQFTEDGGLSRLDRLAAADARLALARLDLPAGALPVALQTEARGAVRSAMRDVADRYEREAVVTASAELLADADLLAESDALLQAELTRSPTPYYLMLGLASNARKRGDRAAALDWHERAYAASQGPATRLQWGAGYVRALVDLAPQDAERIERAARSVIADIDPKPETFYQRNRAALERLGTRLSEWNRDAAHDAVLARLRAQLTAVCGRLPPGAAERATCEGVLAPRSPF
jgi:thioredoxin-related protein